VLFVFKPPASLFQNDDYVSGGVVRNIEGHNLNLTGAFDFDAANVLSHITSRVINDVDDGLNVCIGELARHNKRLSGGGRGSRGKNEQRNAC